MTEYYVVAPTIAVSVYGDEEAVKFKRFCALTAAKIAGRISGVRFEPVFNLSRMMRVIGTINRKGKAVRGRPHRRACFVTEPMPTKSMALHHMIASTEVPAYAGKRRGRRSAITCDLAKIEMCEFVRWCQEFPQQVSEPLWWALITNLAPLAGGAQLIHKISRLDAGRYDYRHTQRVIRRVLEAGYYPVCCKTLVSDAMMRPGRGRFMCSRINRCRAKAPLYLATIHTVYKI